jgi:hypothetical protein
MALEMKTACQQCQAALSMDGSAFICSFECTFCENCTETMDNICPNCGGELVKRPKRLDS